MHLIGYLTLRLVHPFYPVDHVSLVCIFILSYIKYEIILMKLFNDYSCVRSLDKIFLVNIRRLCALFWLEQVAHMSID